MKYSIVTDFTLVYSEIIVSYHHYFICFHMMDKMVSEAFGNPGDVFPIFALPCWMLLGLDPNIAYC